MINSLPFALQFFDTVTRIEDLPEAFDAHLARRAVRLGFYNYHQQPLAHLFTLARGFYQIKMRFDQRAARRPPEEIVPPDAPPNVFTAVQEQLGLKLVGATVERDTLVIDRLERPTAN